MTTNQTTPAIAPFRIEVPEADLQDLHRRLDATRWPDELPDVEWGYGVPVGYTRELVEYWRHGYDWRAWEARLNAHPQFTTTVDGQNVHFLHVRSRHEDALPLILTHGWPGTVVEYLDVVDALTDPEAHGGEAGQAFHLVIPSLPGFAFSGPTTERGWNRYRTARAWAELMARLGYERYGAVGNDAGSFVAPELGRVAPQQVAGVHVTQLFSFPSGDPAEFADLGAQDQAALAFLEEFAATKMAFNQLNSTQPQTLAFALQDSPAGQLAWNAQLFGDSVTRDFILTNVSIYWFTGTAASAARFYYEDAHAEAPAGPTTVPIGLAQFKDDFRSIRKFAHRDHSNIVRWSEFDRGGHYGAHEAPDLLIGDLRAFFGPLR